MGDVSPNPRPYAVSYIENPTQDALRALALEHTPAVLKTGVGSVDKITRNKARMAKFTYVIAESGDERWSGGTLAPAQAAELIQRQQDYIQSKGQLIAIDGYVGLGQRAFGATWLYTLEGANIAGMQQVLAFPRQDVEDDLSAAFQPTFRLVYTPDFFLEDMPGRQAIIVDMANWTTYVMGADYFGESKKGVLRMLNWYVYEQGGLVMHAGAKAVKPADGDAITMTIMGLSGTGKTTTTFSKQGEVAEPVQDDMVCLWPQGQLSITENGCFAKIERLSAESEPVIYAGTTDPSAWLENAYLNADGSFDFYKGPLTPAEVAQLREVLVLTGADPHKVEAYVSGQTSLEEITDEFGIPKDGWDFVVWTQNGRSIIPMSAIPGAADLHNIPAVHSMGILNRDEGDDAAMPGIVRFTSPAQAAGYFMLGETSKTSAAGKERGKTRSPFTQPFFPGQHGLQATRFRELARTMSGVDMWLMNTGFIGGSVREVQEGAALKVKIAHSSAMLEAMLLKEIQWMRDPDFGYDIVDVDAPANAALLSKVPAEILQPKRFFVRQNRGDEYQAWVASMKEGRKAFLESFAVEAAIIEATVGA